mgnify:CR=1 FL=1
MDIMNGLLGFGDKLYQAFLVEDRWRLYLDGLGVTLGITLGAICISTVLGMVLCLMKMSRHRILRWPAQAYIDIIRGIPVVVQLLIMYNVVLLNVTDNKMVVAVIAFGLNSSAYMAEIYRSGINAVDPGQMEAGRSLGLSKVQTMWSVIFPQALKNCLPTYTSEFIVLVKETAVVGYIALGSVENLNGVLHTEGPYYTAGDAAGDIRVGTPGNSVTGNLRNDKITDGNNVVDPDSALAEGSGATLMTGFLEASGTDLATEFANMIIYQRGYQANTRIVTVTDTMLEELVNMKR